MFAEIYTAKKAPLESFAFSINSMVSPIIEKSKDEIIASAPWIVRGPLKLSWGWIVSSLLPILIKVSIEAFMGRYGELVATLINAILPNIKSTLSDEIVSTIERVLVLAEAANKK